MSHRSLPVCVVVAATPAWGIGKAGTLPWPRLQADMEHFKTLTTTVRFAGMQNAVVMGCRTWESLPPRFRPLPGRLNIVLSRALVPAAPPGVVYASSLADALAAAASAEPRVETVFVIGGVEPIVHALAHPLCSTVYLTAVHQEYECDAVMPNVTAAGFELVLAQPTITPDSGPAFSLRLYQRCVDVDALLLGNVLPSAPFANEVAAAHAAALASGSGTYVDPASGYKVMSAAKLASTGKCCGNGCRHCPYAPKHDKGGGTLAPGVVAALGQCCSAPTCCSGSGGEAACELAGAGAVAGAGGGAGGDVIPADAPAGASAVVPSSAPASASAAAPAPGTVLHEHEEMQYLDLVRRIIATGVRRPDRTGVGTLSLFGCSMRFSLRDNVFPLLTTKRVFWRGVAEELLWFLAGSTDAKLLHDKGVKIWDENGSREFLDGRGLKHREEGDLGPVYGFQWRHFGAAYRTMHDDYTGEGVDQLAEVIHQLKTNPSDRRIILSAWNPAALRDMALPPCHMMAQFYVKEGELSCLMYQRAADMGLGVPFNIASYALLTRLLAQVTGLKPGEFVHVLGDTHVYLNHVEPLQEQLGRTPRPFPTLHIDPSVTCIEDFKFEHFTLDGYSPYATIKMAMAV